MLATVGVPERVHVLESERPEGNDGESLQETIVPPLFETLRDVMAVPTTRFNEEGVKVIDGATSFTVSVIVVEPEPAELFAQTAYVVDAVIASGVPQMLPLVVPNVRPEGNEALMAHVVTSPPVLLTKTVEMALSFV